MEALRRVVRRRTRNRNCAITMNPLRTSNIVFKKICESGYARGYDAAMLYKYFESILLADDVDKLKWPVSRELVCSFEVKRLERMLKIPTSTRVTNVKNIYWKRIFLHTLVSSINSLVEEISDNIIRNVDTTLEEVSELTSNLVASLLYMYIISKSKWRSVKNRKLTSASTIVNHVLGEIRYLSEEMNAMFCHHDLFLAWRGCQIVPILVKLDVPTSLI